MKRFITVIVLLGLLSTANGQTFEQSPSPNEKLTIVEGDTIIYYYQVAPQFPGGEEALYKYMEGKIPEVKKSYQEVSDIWITFVIRSNGSIGALNIIQNNRKKLNEHLTQAIKSMPLWKPAEKNGKKMATIGELKLTFVRKLKK